MIPDARSLNKFVYTKENSGELSNVCKTLANNIGERRFYTGDGQRFLPRSIRKKFVFGRPEHFEIVVYQIQYPDNAFLDPNPAESSLKVLSGSDWILILSRDLDPVGF